MISKLNTIPAMDNPTREILDSLYGNYEIEWMPGLNCKFKLSPEQGSAKFVKITPWDNQIMNFMHDFKTCLGIYLGAEFEGVSDFILPKAVSITERAASQLVIIEWLKLDKYEIKNEQDIDYFFRTLKLLHAHLTKYCRIDRRLPVDYLPESYRLALNKIGKETIYDLILQRIIQLECSTETVSHNDIHYGNVFYCEGKIAFVDLDEVCWSDPRNDIGSACANLCSIFFSTPEELLILIKRAFTAYSGYSPSPIDLYMLILFGYRKILHAQAYYFIVRDVMKKSFDAEIAQLNSIESVFADALKKQKAT